MPTICDIGEQNKPSGASVDTDNDAWQLLARARVALASQRSSEAIVMLNRLIEGRDRSIPYAAVTKALETRAHARAKLGDMNGAYADLSSFLSRIKDHYKNLIESQGAQLCGNIQKDKEEEENAELSIRIQLANEHNRIQQRLIVGLGSACGIILILLGALTWISYRHQIRLKALAETDALTGLLNRGAIERRVKSEERENGFAIALLDIDHFKALNDTYGHATGDRALRIFAKAALAVLSETAVIGRWGGEEFLVVFSDLSVDQASVLMDDLRAQLYSDEYAIAPGQHVSFSAGISEVSSAIDTLNSDDVINANIASADAALYRAKAMGRACTAISGRDRRWGDYNRAEQTIYGRHSAGA